MFKKILSLLLILGLITSPVFGADEWMQGTGTDAIDGSGSPSDLDDMVDDYLQNPLNRLLDGYRRGCEVIYASASTVTILEGEVVGESSGGAHRMRENTSSTTVTWSNLDTGSEAASTYYYVYANMDADATTFTASVSTSSSAPSGVTYYRRLGWFYNDASSNITAAGVGNIREGDVPNSSVATGTSDITTTSTTYTDMTDMEVRFVSGGRPILMIFSAPFYAGQHTQVVFDVDGTDYGYGREGRSDGNYINDNSIAIAWLETLSAGTHTIKVQWKTSGGTAYQRGSTDGNRILTVTEL